MSLLLVIITLHAFFSFCQTNCEWILLKNKFSGYSDKKQTKNYFTRYYRKLWQTKVFTLRKHKNTDKNTEKINIISLLLRAYT